MMANGHGTSSTTRVRNNKITKEIFRILQEDLFLSIRCASGCFYDTKIIRKEWR